MRSTGPRWRRRVPRSRRCCGRGSGASRSDRSPRWPPPPTSGRSSAPTWPSRAWPARSRRSGCCAARTCAGTRARTPRCSSCRWYWRHGSRPTRWRPTGRPSWRCRTRGPSLSPWPARARRRPRRWSGPRSCAPSPTWWRCGPASPTAPPAPAWPGPPPAAARTGCAAAPRSAASTPGGRRRRSPASTGRPTPTSWGARSSASPGGAGTTACRRPGGACALRSRIPRAGLPPSTRATTRDGQWDRRRSRREGTNEGGRQEPYHVAMSLSSGMQGYLESLYWLGEAGIDRTPTNLSRAMKVSPPSVTEMVNRLVKEGLVRRGPGKRIALTDHGEEVAKHVVKRHRLVEAFLVKVMGVPWDEVHEEAEAFEMGVTEALEARMLAMIGEIQTCPHGHPIGDYPREPGVPLTGVPGGSVVRVLRFENEDHDLLRTFRRAGVEPRSTWTVTAYEDGKALLEHEGTRTSLPIYAARTISVAVERQGEGVPGEADSA